MGKQLTPEERRIIAQTEREGAKLAEESNEHEIEKKLRPWLNGILLIIFFVGFILLAKFVVGIF